MGRLPDRQCEFCGKWFSNKGLWEHVKYHCPANPNTEKREYSRKRCNVCRKKLHEKSMRDHMWTQHDVASPRSRSRSPKAKAGAAVTR
jgi:hypothetical protein